MKKQTKVLLAAAMLTLGASFSAMAAEKGTWVLESDGWYCYDEDGVAWTDTFCLSYGTEFYVDDEGLLGSCMWLEADNDNDDLYYIQSDGTKTTNAWKYILPYEAEDDDEEGWFWFDAKGRMAKDKRVLIGDDYYYFDAEGNLLTGWVNYSQNSDGSYSVAAAKTGDPVANMIYATETGARATNMWIDEIVWGMDADDAEVEDYHYYYIGSTGKITTGKKDIGGLTYFFGTDGKMLTDWVGYTGKVYEEAANDVTGYSALYYVGDKEQGYAKKNGWRKLANSKSVNTEEEDPSTYWFYFDKNGKAFLPKSATDVDAVTFKDGTGVGTFEPTKSNAVEIKKIDGVEYLFGENGQLVKGLKKFADGKTYYYTYNGFVTGNTSISDSDDYTYEFYFAEKNTTELTKGQAVTGNADDYLYVNGKLVKSSEKGVYKKVTTDAGEFIVNYLGKIQHRDSTKYELEDGTTWKLPEGYMFSKADGITEYSIVKKKAN